MPCWKSDDCLDAQEKSVQVDIDLSGLQPSSLKDNQLAKLVAAYAEELATACDVPKLSVVDLGGANASVSIGPDGLLSAFALSISGLTAHDLASRLYSPSFRYAVGNATEVVLGRHCGVQVLSVSMEPKVFVRTTTARPTTTTEATPTTTKPTDAPVATSTEAAATTTRQRGNSGAGGHPGNGNGGAGGHQGNGNDGAGRHEDVNGETGNGFDNTLGGYSDGATSAAVWPAFALAFAAAALG